MARCMGHDQRVSLLMRPVELPNLANLIITIIYPEILINENYTHPHTSANVVQAEGQVDLAGYSTLKHFLIL
jgi:hypothetical protein